MLPQVSLEQKERSLKAAEWAWEAARSGRPVDPYALLDLGERAVHRSASLFGHGERSRLQVLLKFAGTVTAASTFWLFNNVRRWLFNFGC